MNGDAEAALAAWEQAVSLRPNCAATRNNLGLLLQQLGRPGHAMAAYNKAISLRPDLAEAHANLGVLLQQLGRHDEAMAALRRAIALQPGLAETHLNAGLALQELGHADAARAAIEQALQADPGHALAWYALSDLKTFTAGDPDIARLEKLQNAPARPAPERIRLAFALAKARMDTGDTGQAFACLHRANSLKRASFAYDVTNDTAQMAQLARVIDADFLRRFAGAGATSGAPVFILGMPRSGTTLVEQILASHAAVAGAGELPVLPGVLARGLGQSMPQGAEDQIRAAFRRMGEDYLRRVPALLAGQCRMTDSAAGIFQFAGLIHLMLPNARLIHCRRDPIDTCFSCYTKDFVELHRFAYDLTELGAYSRACAAIMAHWRTVLPDDRFMEIDYETVVGDLEGQARRLVAFCGLSWDESCLAFHQTSRVVRTASVNQVRQPIYASSIGRWRPYAPYLGPLLAALGLDGGPS